MPEKPRPSYVKSKNIDGVTFDNVRVNGKLISGKKDLTSKVLTNEFKGHLGPDQYGSPFSHDKEVVKAGYHKVVLDRYDITAGLTLRTAPFGENPLRLPSGRLKPDPGIRLSGLRFGANG